MATVSVLPGLDEIAVTVSDNGPGVSDEALQRLFDRFYRVDAARYNGKTHGHGLGLAIVRAIATMHGGDVFASSADGITTIGFSVPAADSSREATSEARSPRPAGRMGPSGHMV
jgi:two-component system heavy metal sensor histidine kinase CusS